MTPGLLPEGLRDRLPPEAEAAAALVATLLGTLASHGYERVQPPLMEYEESLAGRLANTDRRELLRFIDPVSQRTLALRPDITGQVARIAATRLAHVPRPLRLSYAGPVLRVKGSQLTPEREMLQAGAELIGSDSVAAVVEMLRLAVEAVTAAGLTGLTVDLTMPSLVGELAAVWPLAEGKLTEVRARLDGKDVAGLRAAGGAAYEPLIAAAGPVDSALATLRGLALPSAITAHIDDVAAVVAALPAGLPVTLDPTERHGFEYQSWIGFSLFAAGVRGEVGRGGSYQVIHETGDERAVGFSLFVDGLVDAGLGLVERRRVWLPFGTPADAGAELRAQGWMTVAALDADALVSDCSHRWTASGVQVQEPTHGRP
ncbi:ATP phosphoribosyltransferase regulatory subunit [Glacieibacterium sp.]|uniref:ATP phosphoribosyltransferase regulatory subunit n=1 Tax=Glacieibacterium sp. TaxID=2860237 RepID=UPI003B00B4A4